MKISLKILNAIFSKNLDPEKVQWLLSISGMEIDNICNFGNIDNNIVVAKILDANPIPKSKHLKLVTVDAGEKEKFQVICGANNCRPGIYSILAKVGAILETSTGPIKIKEKKLLGETSKGMLCSASELNIGWHQDSIIELDDTDNLKNKIGNTAQSLFQDTIFDVTLTPNISRCSSIFGVAELIELVTGHFFTIQNETRLYELPGFRELLTASLCCSEALDKSNAPIATVVKYHQVNMSQKHTNNCFLQALAHSLGLTTTLSLPAIIFGTPLHKESTCIYLLPKEILNESKTLKCSDTKPGSQAIDLGIELFCRMHSIWEYCSKVEPKSFIDIKIDIERFCKIYKGYSNAIPVYSHLKDVTYESCKEEGPPHKDCKKSDKETIVSALNKCFPKSKIAENIISIPSHFKEYFDQEHILGLINKIFLQCETLLKIPNVVLPHCNVGFEASWVWVYVNAHFHRTLRHRLTQFGFSQIVTNPIISDTNNAMFKDAVPCGISSALPLQIIGKDMFLRRNLFQSMSVALQENHTILNAGANQKCIFELGMSYGKTKKSLFTEEKLAMIFIPKVQKTRPFEHKDSLARKSVTGVYELSGFIKSIFKQYNKGISIENAPHKMMHPHISGTIKHNMKDIGIIGKLNANILKHLDITKPVFYAEFYIDKSMMFNNLKRIITKQNFSKFYDITVKVNGLNNDLNQALQKLENKRKDLKIKNHLSCECIDVYQNKKQGTTFYTVRLGFDQSQKIDVSLMNKLEEHLIQ